MWDLVGQRRTSDTHSTASKDELLLRTQAIWNYFSQEDILNLFDSMPGSIAVLIAVGDGYTKY